MLIFRDTHFGLLEFGAFMLFDDYIIMPPDLRLSEGDYGSSIIPVTGYTQH